MKNYPYRMRTLIALLSAISMVLFISIIAPSAALAEENISVSTVGALQQAVDQAEDNTTVTLADNFVFSDTAINMPDKNVSIDGSGLTWNAGTFTISGNGTGSLTIENFKFDGSHISGTCLMNKAGNGTVIINNTEIFDSSTGAIGIAATGNARTVISHTKIYNNESYNAAAAINISGNNTTSIEINHVTIEENTGLGAGYECGAIAAKFYSGDLRINNSVFRNNINNCMNSGITGGGGGAMSFHYLRGNISINESYFQENKTNGTESPVASTYDGGAIYIFDGRDGATITIDKTTFDSNLAYDDGGALLIQGTGNPGLTTTITNSTFYNNKAYGLTGGNRSGGAIQFFKNGGSSKMTNVVTSCTFTGNQSGNEKTTVEQRGGAVGLSGAGLFATATVTNTNALYIGNSVYDSTGEVNNASNYKDVSNTSTLQEGASNVINADRSAVPKYTTQMVLGTDDPDLVNNYSSITAGMDGEVIRTIPIKPEGIADNTNTGAGLLPEDQRGFKRYKDNGAVEMSWAKYNANGGQWKNLPEMVYRGVEYYEKDSSGAVENYFKVAYEDGEVTIPENPVRDGYVFDGWKNLETGAIQNDWPFVLDDNIIFEAQWRAAEYIVIFDAQGGSAVAPITNVASGSLIAEPEEPDYEGLFFEGWYKEAGTITPWNFAADTVTEDITLYAKWSKVLLYTVTFDSQGGSEVAPVVGIIPGSFVTEPEEPTREDFIFTGWYKEAECLSLWDFRQDKINDNITLYADWEPIPLVLYTVTFDSQGGSPVESIHNVNAGSVIAEPEEPKMEGYVFNGWHKEPEGFNSWDFENYTINEDTTLYAKWSAISAPETYTVSFDSQGGSPVEALRDIPGGSTVKMPTEPVRDGYKFGGWFIEAEALTAWNFDTGRVNGNMTLYAKWTAVPTENGDKETHETLMAENRSEGSPHTGVFSGVSISVIVLLVMASGVVLAIRVRKRKQD